MKITHVVVGVWLGMVQAASWGQATQGPVALGEFKLPPGAAVQPSVWSSSKTDLTILKHTEVQPDRVRLDEFLAKRGVKPSSEAKDLFKKFNPDVLDGEFIKRDSKIIVWGFKAPPRTPDNPWLGFEALKREEVARASVSNDVGRAKTVADQVASDAFASQPQFAKQVFKQTGSELAATADLLKTKSPTMSDGDIALARFELARASAELAEARKQAQKGELDKTKVDSVDRVGQVLKYLKEMMSSGKSLTEPRRVHITLLGATSGRAKELKVYVLPADMVERPDRYDAGFVKEMLYLYAFLLDEGTVPRGDYRLWLGADGKYLRMLEVVLAKALNEAPRPVRGTDPDVAEVRFRYPFDLVK